MKKAIHAIVIVLALALSGCSGGGSDTSSPTKPDSSGEEISDVDPGLTQSGYYRDELTDPALYDYLSKQSGGVTNPGVVVPGEGSDKIGKSANFDKNRKYEITGVAQIISANKIRVSSFNYNGACGPVYFGLALRANEEKPLANLKEISSAQSGSSFDLAIPSNISLIQFELLNIYCYTDEEPVSTAKF